MSRSGQKSSMVLSMTAMRTSTATLCVLFVCILCAGANGQTDKATAYKAGATCAVAAFKQAGAAAGAGYLSDVIQQSLHFELSRSKVWPLGERARLKDVLTETDLKAAGIAEGRPEPVVGADLVIVGEFDDQDGLVVVHARLVDVKTAIVQGQAKWTGHVSGITDDMSRRIVAGLANQPIRDEPLSPAIEALFKEACRSLKDGDVDRTIELCNKILDDRRGHIPTLLIRGYAELNKKGFSDRARRDFKRIIELDLRNVAAKLGLARAELDGDSRCESKALPWLRQVLDEQPENGEALYLAALVHQRLSEQDKALDFAKRATRELPHFGPAWAILAEAYKARSDFASALKAALQATACDDRDPGLWMLLGDVQSAAGQKPAAVQSFRKAMDRKPPPMMKEMLEARLKEYK